jgi:hypothetical protein
MSALLGAVLVSRSTDVLADCVPLSALIMISFGPVAT